MLGSMFTLESKNSDEVRKSPSVLFGVGVVEALGTGNAVPAFRQFGYAKLYL
jgi:hypothetical protein